MRWNRKRTESSDSVAGTTVRLESKLMKAYRGFAHCNFGLEKFNATICGSFWGNCQWRDGTPSFATLESVDLLPMHCCTT